ncbi:MULTISPECIES: malonate transporter subunit MadL [unclassified Halanaerobium]|uniref:malonate transporter subunit MadL n=1 Tax=unclassified Halanaerobium TaxID=2641197 RepID=UPI000DF48CB2|nr:MULTISPECIES: malonate transporter subunit MadL [unclassified Halanaerobium]RCW46633.1 malonate transporter MadL subunit [Halanaerobium sp. MA284_MarDTE_T2]RCW83481.1 malonate transporter MadL subunit [Halanaerobium sp. DL-01]
MEILGMGYVALFMLIGSFLGRILGQLIGVGGDVGGVGIAMLLMVVTTNYLKSKGRPLHKNTERGVKFLSAIYIPVIVAMAARLNVVGALRGGFVALLAGGVATIGAMFLVPLISKLRKTND